MRALYSIEENLMNYYLINYKLNGIGESGESCGSEYSFNESCKTCGTGARINTVLKVKGIGKSKKHLFSTQDGDFVISSALYSKIKSVMPSFILEQVVNTKGEYLDYFHLVANMTLAPFEEESSGYVIENQCPICHRNGYFNDIKLGDLENQIPTKVKPLSFIYSEKHLSNLEESEVFETWESIGLSNLKANDNNAIRFARPWFIITENLKKIFESFNVNDVEFQPILAKPK